MLIRVFFFFFFFSIFPLIGNAAIISKAKNNRYLIDLEGSQVKEGDHFEALDIYGKIRGIIRIVKVRKNKAIGIIVDGVAGPNWILQQTSQDKLPIKRRQKKFTIGILPSINYSFASRDPMYSNKRLRYSGLGFGSVFLFQYLIQKYWLVGGQLGFKRTALEGEDTQRRCPKNICSTWMFWLPYIKLSTYFNLLLPYEIRVIAGGGINLSHWGQNDGDTTILSNNSYKKIQTSVHLSLGAYFPIPKIHAYVPVILNYNIIQPFTSLFKSSQENINIISIQQITLQTGISYNF